MGKKGETADSRGRTDTEVGLDRKPGIKLAGLTKKNSRQEWEKVRSGIELGWVELGNGVGTKQKRRDEGQEY